MTPPHHRRPEPDRATGTGAPARTSHPPIRAMHLGLGLGAFHRSHQAWYTQRANETGTPWGISAFTGRSSAAADLLSMRDGVFTLLVRSADGDRTETVQSIVRATPGTDEAAWTATITDPDVAVLTVTVTESGYASAAAPPARIAAGLRARRAAGAGPIAVVSCDNLLGNGRALRDAVLSAASADAAAIAEAASFVDTVVDRITPATTADDLDAVRALTGIDDPAAVVTEPFTEWVLAGDFPGGRPAWEHAGARFVDDVVPYEERKLWLLNAAHSILSAGGGLAGHETIAEAFADTALRDGVEALWQEQRAQIRLPQAEIDDWLDALRVRFDNPRIAHRLAQIRRDSPIKIPQRLLPPIRRRIAAGLLPGEAQLAAVETWVRSVRELEPTDATTAALARALETLPPADRVPAVIRHLAPDGALG